MYLLDTDILIDVQRGYLPAIAWFSSLTEIPSIPGFVRWFVDIKYLGEPAPTEIKCRGGFCNNL